eukprot:TRINITY_DN3991_c0_g2_i1.p1 TRINITY_DN3991_c0_g2~~TRINITY_DN3991_c0_g2_i1.p1  ORF type:complete len:513 (-),score=61.40 TRINITY_DN3991_c0_g2_i1:80-1618(-)
MLLKRKHGESEELQNKRRAKTEATINIFDLPDDVGKLCIQYCDQRSKLALRSTCKQFLSIIMASTLLTPFPSSENDTEELCSFLNRASDLHSYSLDLSYCHLSNFNEVAKSFPKDLKGLIINKQVYISEETIKYLPTALKNLQFVGLPPVSLLQQSPSLVELKIDMQKELQGYNEASHADLAVFKAIPSSLQRLKIKIGIFTQEKLEALPQDLKLLRLHGTFKIFDFTKFPRNLTELYYKSNTSKAPDALFSEKDIRILLQHLPHLKRLTVGLPAKENGEGPAETIDAFAGNRTLDYLHYYWWHSDYMKLINEQPVITLPECLASLDIRSRSEWPIAVGIRIAKFPSSLKKLTVGQLDGANIPEFPPNLRSLSMSSWRIHSGLIDKIATCVSLTNLYIRNLANKDSAGILSILPSLVQLEKLYLFGASMTTGYSPKNIPRKVRRLDILLKSFAFESLEGLSPCLEELGIPYFTDIQLNQIGTSVTSLRFQSVPDDVNLSQLPANVRHVGNIA